MELTEELIVEPGQRSEGQREPHHEGRHVDLSRHGRACL